MSGYPSIFNDVVGPVMRGPSSSHSAAGLRIGRIARDLMGGDIEDVLIEYDPNGSLVTTHKSQGTDMGLYGGFLGWDAHDERLLEYRQAVAESGINIRVEYAGYGATHPNTYKLTLKNGRQTHELYAISTGGGMIVVEKIDGADVRIEGGFFETLVYLNTDRAEVLIQKIQGDAAVEEVALRSGNKTFVEIKSVRALPEDILKEIEADETVAHIRTIDPVLPVLSRIKQQVPFITCEEMIAYNKGRNLELWELAVHYEAMRGGLTHEEVFDKMKDIVGIMANAIDLGLKGTEYNDRILPAQSVGFKAKNDAGHLIGNGVQNMITMYVSALMEVKSSMGVIVAAPTAGSCGAFPGAVIASAHFMEKDDDEIVKAMLAGAMIGIYIAAHSTFAAESAGCQAECGSASGMAAAALVQLGGGTLEQALAAASMALQNCFGMVCDPIGNRVEAPCLGKNNIAAVNALSCANMALADYQHLIPLDEVITAFDIVGRSINRELRCTALGGLSVTKSAKEIESRLQQ